MDSEIYRGVQFTPSGITNEVTNFIKKRQNPHKMGVFSFPVVPFTQTTSIEIKEKVSVLVSRFLALKLLTQIAIVHTAIAF